MPDPKLTELAEALAAAISTFESIEALLDKAEGKPPELVLMKGEDDV